MIPRVLCSLALASGLLVGTAAPADAACFGFRGESIKVCVPGNDNAARRRAADVCEDVTGHGCSVSGTSGSCQRSSSTRCYDGDGDEQRSIDPD